MKQPPTEYKLFRGRDYCGMIVADRVESEVVFPDDPYCTVFRTRFITDELISAITWSDQLSWRTGAI